MVASERGRQPVEDRPRDEPLNWRWPNFTVGEYLDKLAEQGGTCALCPSKPKRRALHVDHDHVTGAVRGLLCFTCNRFLLHGRATPEKLRRAADYLERHATA